MPRYTLEERKIIATDGEATARSVPEWIGATPDTKVPPRVRLRVFEAFGGRCYLSGKKIMPGDAWEIDHIRALKNGGENREKNLAPVLAEKHKAKTAADNAEKSKTYRMRAKHLGIWPKGQTIPSRPFPSKRKAARP